MKFKDFVSEGQSSYKKLDFDELLEKYMQLNKLFNFEGTRGLRNLETVVKGIGYRSVDEFLMDNLGAMEAIINWILDQKFQDWHDSLLDNMPVESEEE